MSPSEFALCADTVSTQLNAVTWPAVPTTATQLHRQSWHIAASLTWNILPNHLHSASVSKGQFWWCL